MAIYMKYSSPDIKGGVTTEGFKDQTNILSFQFGIGRAVASPTGGTTNREASTPSVSEITLTKEWDEASGGLIKEAYSGQGKATVVISFVRTDATGGVAFTTYTLTNTMLSGWSTSSGGDGKPAESFSLNFTKIETKFIYQKPDGTTGDNFPVTYDLGLQKMS
jgi:type VI secretion system secreted protein Hcp